MKRHPLTLLVYLSILIWISVIAVQPVYAVTIEVTTTDPGVNNTDGDCSLTEAIANANNDALTHNDCSAGSGADIITFNVAGDVEVLSSISIADDLTISGPVTLNGFDGTNKNQMFVINAGITLTLDGGVTLTNGNPAILMSNNGAVLNADGCFFTDNGETTNRGAAINVNSNSTININDCIFDGNTAQLEGGAIYTGGSGGLTNPVTITNSIFINNTAGENGGAIRTASNGSISGSYFGGNTANGVATNEGGGAIFFANNANVAVNGSVFTGNRVTGADGRGGAIHTQGTGTTIFVNFSHFGGLPVPIPAFNAYASLANPNEAAGANGVGGAIYALSEIYILGSSFFENDANDGGAFAGRTPNSVSSFIANSTFTGNSANNRGGAIYQFTETGINTEIDLINVTIAGNSASDGGGIFLDQRSGTNDPFVRLSNTIVADNVASVPDDNCGLDADPGSVIDQTPGNNLIFGSSCDGITAGGDPNLQPLALEISLPTIVTFVRPLGDPSAALGAGDQSVCSAIPILNTDQRNIPNNRPSPSATNCDIGAYESSIVPEPEINVQGNATDISIGSSIPNVTNGTDFGSTPEGTFVDRTFTIFNEGSADLIINSVTVPTGFNLQSSPGSPIMASNSSTFTVRCLANDDQNYAGDIVIDNNDSDESSYNFAIECQVDGPDIAVSGMGDAISNGDITPVTTDGTDFGTPTLGETAEQTFRITNNGTAVLNMTNVTVPSGFTYGGSTSFSVISTAFQDITVACDTTTTGIKSGNVSIDHDDTDTPSPYEFAITCNVEEPEIAVSGTTDIPDGSAATTSNGTDFGDVNINTTAEQVITITNSGLGDLTLGTPTVTAASGFSITGSPSSVVTSGNSTNFTLVCDTTTIGTKTATVEFTTNDANENPFNFSVACNVTEPDINVTGTTNFGSTTVGTPVQQTFTIENTGNGTLNLGTITPPAGYTITIIPTSTTLNPTDTTTFTVECSAGAPGIFSGDIIIASNDPDENPFNLAVTCEVTNLPTPEITVEGTANVVDDSVTASTTNGTDFGQFAIADTAVQVFTITNNGTLALTVGIPTVTGTRFSITSNPAASIDPGNNTTFEVTCDTTSTGNATETIEFTNNDPNENPFNFVVACAVAEPGINVTDAGMLTTIANEDTTPDLADGTDFGSTGFGVPTSENFTIESIGTGDLSVTGITVTGDFSIITPTSFTTAPTNTETLTVQCNATTVGTAAGTVTITSNDPDTSSYTFDVLCEVTATPEPEIDVTGNGDFGTIVIGTTATETFTIENIGSANLTLGLITVPTGFTAIPNDLSSVSPLATNGTTTFAVQCDTSAVASYSGNLAIVNNDSDENPFIIALTCEVEAEVIEINVTGNAIDIPAVGNSPNLADGTDFGVTVVSAPIIRTFEIENQGNTDMAVSSISVPPGFTLTQNFTSPIAAGDTGNFDVTCDAMAINSYSGNINIVSNDPDENPYVIAITCEVTNTAPEIDITGNGNPITNGDTTVVATNGTLFASTTEGTPITRTFTIVNTGTANLTLNPATLTGTGFTITTNLTSPVLASADTLLQVTCDAAAVGTYTAVVNVVNNDADENPFTFAIQCEVTGVVNNTPPDDSGEQSATPQIDVFDPALSKIGFLVPGQVGLTGEQLEWVVTVRNIGTAAGTNVAVTDTLIPALQIDRVEAPGGTVTIIGQTVTVTYAVLNPGQIANFSIFTTVVDGIEDIQNTVCVADECTSGRIVTKLPSTGETPWWRSVLMLITMGIAGFGIAWLAIRVQAD